MKKAMTGLGLSLVAVAAFAQGSGGFTGPDNLRVVTTVEAAALADDTAVKLQGYIVKSLGDERYEFRDDSGTIVVEIDGDDWHGIKATPETRIELRGEVDKEWKSTEIDVDSVSLVP
jgi:uncharacterized protein (TIGR00156 family)